MKHLLTIAGSDSTWHLWYERYYCCNSAKHTGCDDGAGYRRWGDRGADRCGI